MLIFFFLSMIPFLIALIILSLNFMMAKKKNKNREKSSPFECGFDPLNNNRIPLSIHFFLISLLFLIFDIEITLLIPLIFSFMKFNKYMILSFALFLIILIIGLFIEYSEHSIDWKN